MGVVPIDRKGTFERLNRTGHVAGAEIHLGETGVNARVVWKRRDCGLQDQHGRRDVAGGGATASVDTQIRPLIDTSKPAIN